MLGSVPQGVVRIATSSIAHSRYIREVRSTVACKLGCEGSVSKLLGFTLPFGPIQILTESQKP
jgi:hypothetical protein